MGWVCISRKNDIKKTSTCFLDMTTNPIISQNYFFLLTSRFPSLFSCQWKWAVKSIEMDSSVSSSIDYEADIGKSSLVPRRSLLSRVKSEVRAGVLTMMAIRGGSARKGYLFQASGIWKGKDFTSWSILTKGRQICHLGLWKGPKGITDEFYGFIKSRKRSVFVIDSYLRDSAFTVVKRDAMF